MSCNRCGAKYCWDDPAAAHHFDHRQYNTLCCPCLHKVHASQQERMSDREQEQS